VLILQTAPVAERLRVREIDDDEGRRLVRIVRRGSGSVVPWRRAQIVLLSAQGMYVAAPFVSPFQGSAQGKIFLAAMAKYAVANTAVDSIAEAGFATVMNVQQALSHISGAPSTKSILAAFKSGSGHPNFMSHPYTCDGQAVAKAASICNDYYLMEQIQGGKPVQASTTDWVTSKGFFKGLVDYITATPIVELTEGPYSKANPPQHPTLRTARIPGRPPRPGPDRLRALGGAGRGADGPAAARGGPGRVGDDLGDALAVAPRPGRTAQHLGPQVLGAGP